MGVVAFLIVVWAVKEFVTHVQYAAKGQPPPRTQERLAAIQQGTITGTTRPFGTPGRNRYGLRDLAADSWFDGCHRVRQWQLERQERRAAANGEAVLLDTPEVDRVEAAPSRFGWFGESARRVGRALWEPVGEPKPATEEADVIERKWNIPNPDFRQVAPDRAAVPDPLEAPAADDYVDVADPQLRAQLIADDEAEGAGLHANDRQTCWGCRTWATEEHIRSEQHRVMLGRDGERILRWYLRQDDNNTPPTTTPATGGTSMEASNYESAVAALGELADAARNLTDHVAGAAAAANQFADHVNEVDEARQQVADAISVVTEQLAAKGVSTSAVAQVQTAMEQLHAGDLNAALDYVEAAKNALAGAQAAAAEASGGVASAQDDLVATYGDAHATMAARGTDGSFIDGSGSGAGSGAGGSSGYVNTGSVSHVGEAVGPGATTTTGGGSGGGSGRTPVATPSGSGNGPSGPAVVNSGSMTNVNSVVGHGASVVNKG